MGENDADLERAIGVRFRDRTYFVTALTHRSYLHEHPAETIEANERLEFLGDAILQFIVAEMLFRRFPDAAEGELTELRALLVSTTGLAAVAEELGLHRYVRASRGVLGSHEATSPPTIRTGAVSERGRPRILAGAIEALIAAVFVDQGIAEARSVAERLIAPRVATVLRDVHTANVKGRLQEFVQARNGETPRYFVVDRDGPVHAERFAVEVRVGQTTLGRGEGIGKRAAELVAARQAIASIEDGSTLDFANTGVVPISSDAISNGDLASITRALPRRSFGDDEAEE